MQEHIGRIIEIALDAYLPGRHNPTEQAGSEDLHEVAAKGGRGVLSAYSDRSIAHIEVPHRNCAISEADLVGRSGRSGQGPFMRLAGDRIASASFRTYGCPAAIASGSAIAALAESRTLAEASALTEADLNAELGGLPRNKRHCLGLAMGALREALRKAEESHGS